MKYQKIVKDYLIITGGLIIVALAIHLFMVPNKFVVGGISGLGIVLQNLLSKVPENFKSITIFGKAISIAFLFSLSGIMFILNTILYLLGFLLIGKTFGIRTLYSGYMLNFIYFLLERFFPIKEPLMNDLLTQLIIMSAMSALGLSIVFKCNASTGGTDITGKILNKYFHIDLGKAVLISDVFITITAFSINGLTSFIYGMFGIFLNGIFIDYLLQKFSESKEVVIISKEIERIKDYIINVLDRSATIYEARGAYTNEEKEIIRTVLSKREFIKLKEFISSIDREAFITVNNIHQTFGLGFTDITD